MPGINQLRLVSVLLALGFVRSAGAAVDLDDFGKDSIRTVPLD